MGLAEGARVCPGDRLGDASGCVPGRGARLHGQYVCASTIGTLATSPAPPNAEDQRMVVEVLMPGREQTLVPKPGDTVTVKVTKINPRLAAVDILCVGPRALEEKFQGVVRQQDVRATEVDKVKVIESFRPGDVVRAEVLSMGDQRSYYLSTAKDELGVIYAQSLAGHDMVPISWTEMQCSKTHSKELRKVANKQDVKV